jgi:Leucine-rich repeat (LRR) protein
LSSTNLASLNGIGGAKKLQELHVTDNGLKGTIPSELFWLTNLRRLYMSFNAFSGTLSGKLLANLTNLEDFYMFGNNITGTIPSEVGKLQALREFIMPANNLNGTVPSQFSSLSRLEQLSLYDQQGAVVLSGPIPTFANSPRLWYACFCDDVCQVT